MNNTINRKSCIGISIQNNIGLRNCCSKSFSLKPITLKMSTYIRQSAQSYKGFIYGKLTALTQQPQSGRKKVALARKPEIPSISKIKNSIIETSRHHYKQLTKAQQTKVVSTGLWDINFLYARTCFQADKKQAYRSERPCFPRKTSNQGRSIVILHCAIK